MVASSDDFQVHTNTNQRSRPVKRIYIGGLPKNNPDLQKELEAWLKEQIPQLEIASIEVNSQGKTPHALVDCGQKSGAVISKLNQRVWQGRKLTVQRERRNGGTKQKAINPQNNHGRRKHQSGFRVRGWSKPKEEKAESASSWNPIPIDQATDEISAVLSKEIEQAEEKGEDLVNTALASTAAVSLLASMGAFLDTNGNSEDLIESSVLGTVEEPTESDEGFVLKPMADLLADFGEADPDWKKKEITETAEPVPETTSRLAPHGKAPIRIVFSSFGFHHGAPPRMDGWSHRQPLLPFDCRDFETVPRYMSWQNGTFGSVKRVLMKHVPELRYYARNTVIDQVWDCLVEAQEAGHGYASPLEMTIYVGSESGRHRAVVVCEWAATQLRKRLRKNDKDSIQQPVSVGTVHRDIDQHRDKKKSQTNWDQGHGRKKNVDFADEDW